MTTLEELVSLCAGEVAVTVNEHRTYYQSLAEYLADNDEGLDDATKAEAIRRDTMAIVQAYPRTPIGFYRIVHWSVEEALRLCLAAVKESA